MVHLFGSARLRAAKDLRVSALRAWVLVPLLALAFGFSPSLAQAAEPVAVDPADAAFLQRLEDRKVIKSVAAKGEAVTVRGLDAKSQSLSRTWWLLADNDHGPQIPCFPAIALARKLLRGEVSARGAMPCMGLLTVEEILDVGRGLDLRSELTSDQ